MESIARKVIFKGRVQGVGFRYTAHRAALKWEMLGYVKNLPDGNVEMLAQGHPADVKECIDEINDYFSTYLTDTDIQEVPLTNAYATFLITF